MKQLDKFFQINTIKVDESDKYIITVGRYQAHPDIFETEQEAEDFFKEKFMVKDDDWYMFIFALQMHFDEILQELKKQTKLN